MAEHVVVAWRVPIRAWASDEDAQVSDTPFQRVVVVGVATALLVCVLLALLVYVAAGVHGAALGLPDLPALGALPIAPSEGGPWVV